MKNLITYIMLAVLLTACSKNNNKQVTVTGRLMQSCDTPAANKDGIIRLSGGGLLNNPSTSLEFTTDENGYFKVTHNEAFSDFSVRTSANHSVLEASISGDEKELGEVYINPFPTNFVIKLDVKNPYTENDTLMMFDFKNPNAAPSDVVLFAGPFDNGTLDSIVNYNFSLFPIDFAKNEDLGPKLSIRHMVRSIDNVHLDKYTSFKTAPICSGEFAEVTLVIE
jgi:hypothetical protein